MADENIADDVTCLTALPDTQWVEEVKDRVDTRYILHGLIFLTSAGLEPLRQPTSSRICVHG